MAFGGRKEFTQGETKWQHGSYDTRDMQQLRASYVRQE